jgi:hypothetical protein
VGRDFSPPTLGTERRQQFSDSSFVFATERTMNPAWLKRCSRRWMAIPIPMRR